jgi:photosystem II stability/assembly factor-like uncharacterized protein
VLLSHLSFAALLSVTAAASVRAQHVDPSMYSEMRWRMIGPFRASRTKAAAGIPSQPNVFYVGVVNGGVWKTTDYGRTWNPIFDEQPTGSVGAIAVAPSNPNVIYVGSGEGLQRPDLSVGDGIYKSTDAGATWTHLGLRDGQQIPQIAVDPRDPDKLFAAVLGHPYGPNAERGLFRSTDGGRTFQKALYRDENIGAVDVVLDPANPDIVYAVLWEARQGPWENGAFSGSGSGLFKSTDAGTTWRRIGNGLPTFEQDGLGRIGITVAPSMPSRMFATVEARRGAGLYRSDDAGESWHLATTDDRVATRPSDAAEVKVDPKNPEIVYTATVVSWKSTDGGKTWKAFRGAPGGDDYQRLWINPIDPNVILLVGDQGAIVTVNGGATWSSWLNQPTAAFYHVSTDNAFPYRVCSGQQESGSACVRSRGDDGRILAWDWHPVGVEEYGYVAPDPLDPDLVYGGKVSRFDRRTGTVQQVGPRVGRGGGGPLPGGVSEYRTLRTAPLVFSTVDPHALFFASNVVWKTTNGGKTWAAISPDLTRRDSIVPPSVGVYSSSAPARARHGGVVYTVAPSYVDINRIWAGSDDGLIHTTSDGGAHWSDVTPPELRDHPWSKVSIIDAGRFDAKTAYAAVNTIRLDDLRPHVFRTHDGGKTWTQITTGIPDGATVNVVREDSKHRGLLFAGTETQVWVSFDDGNHWSSLRLNMPATSIRDLVLKDDDIVVGTHGRSFWILDDIAPLREVAASTSALPLRLFKPATAIRFRSAKYTDTPIPPDEPGAQNPPDGAIVDYYVGAGTSGDASLEILDGGGRVIRRYSSRDTSMAPADLGNTPSYWIRPTKILSAAAGFHRFVWDLRFSPPAGTSAQPGQYPISAVPFDTPREPSGPLVTAGTYSVRLSVGSRIQTQPLTVRMDPRIKTPADILARQHALAVSLWDDITRDSATTAQIRDLRAKLRDARDHADASLAQAISAYDDRLNALAGQSGGGGRRGGGGGGGRGAGGSAQPTVASVNGEVLSAMTLIDGTDGELTPQALAVATEARRSADTVDARWTALRTTELAALNAKLRAAGLPVVVVGR